MSYSIKVTNNSGEAANIAIYQVMKNQIDGFPLVWMSRNIYSSSIITFSWNTDFGLNWGTSAEQLAPGVAWEAGGTVQSVEANSGGDNEMLLSYAEGNFVSSPVSNNPNIPNGSLQILTDTSFNVAESKKMSVALYMADVPIITFQGAPNRTYTLNTDVSYFLCLTDTPTGSVLTNTALKNYIGSTMECIFQNGVTELSFTLTDKLEFVQD